MSNASPPHLVWAHRARGLLGFGEAERIDPGVGPDRYRRALEGLRVSGHGLAFASFTFDPDVAGSVVVIPEQLTETPPWGDFGNGAPLPEGRVISDGTEEWRRAFDGALEALDADRVEKVVLTRQVAVEFEGEIPLHRVVRRLIDHQPDCYTFLIDGLVGASPELLVSLQDGLVSSLALAGTANDVGELVSPKNDREHVLAATSVESGIAHHVTDLRIPARSVLEFGEIKHLATRFEGSAVSGATVLDILESLHPTASVAGTPSKESVRLIRELEPWPRGRYAGPVGWFNSDGEGEFAIALRCGSLRGSRATLFAGGGIVVGSNPDSELAETELKLQPMLQALGAR